MDDQRNLMIAILLTMVILFGYDFFIAQTAPPPSEQATFEEVEGGSANGATTAPTASDGDMTPSGNFDADALRPGQTQQSEALVPREQNLRSEPRIQVEAPRIHGSIRLRGGRLDDLTLIDHRESLDPTSPEIVLLSPTGSEDAYYVDYGWQSAGGITVPNGDTVWTASSNMLTETSPVTLTWDNGQGLRFERIFSIDENYLITVQQSVTNTGGEAVQLRPYSLIQRRGTPEISGFFISDEGPVGVFNGAREFVEYEDLREEGLVKFETTGGWMGFSDKYWMAALLPDQTAQLNAELISQNRDGVDRYQAAYFGDALAIGPGQTVNLESHVFAGAKEGQLINQYEEMLDIDLLNRAIDWGWFWWLTRPIFAMLSWIYGIVGNWGVAILVLTVLIKAVFFQLASKSYVSMSGMRKLQPKMQALRERYADDKQKQQEELMKLYKEENVNPVSGCLPILIQIPVFFALYKVLFITIEMRHAPFFGWIQDLSAPDPLLVTNLFGLIPWDPPSFLAIGVWPVLMGISMFAQQKLNPAPPDPIQARIFMLMPILFTFILAPFPAGLVIYWTWNNVLTIAQQYVIMKRHGAFDEK